MKYQIVKGLTIKTGEGKRLLQARQVIQLPKDKALPLIEAGLIAPEAKETTFDRLFHEHMERLKQCDTLPDEIEPAKLAEIHRAVEGMDKAWLEGDLPEFKEAMQQVESLYFEKAQVKEVI